MKHIIITGREESGKTLLAKLLFSSDCTLYKDGRTFFKEVFPYDNGADDWNYKNILIDDITATTDELISLVAVDELKINRQSKPVINIPVPMFVFTTDNKIESDKASFNRRFHIIDTDTTSIAEILKIIKEESIIIKTHW